MNLLEYIGQPEATAEMFTADGFSRSGDLGVMDDDGYVRVTGRVKDIVIRGGLNISVRQVEDLLTAHPAVNAVAAVGMPDDVLGERVCCYLVPAPDTEPLTVEQMKEYLLGQGLAVQKVPERVEVVTALPMTATGKVQTPSRSPKIVITIMAPAAAPDDRPNRKGSARSFRVIVCSSTPMTARPLPTHSARITRGNRKSITIRATGAGTPSPRPKRWPASTRNTAPEGSGVDP